MDNGQHKEDTMTDYNYTVSREGLRIALLSLQTDVNSHALPEEYREEARQAVETMRGALENGEPLYVPFEGEDE